MSRLSEGQSVQNLFSSISYIPLETNEQAIIGKYPECIIMDSAILVSSVHQNLKLFDRTNGKYIRDIGHVGTDPEGYAKDSWGKVSFWADAVRRTVYLLGWNNDFLLYGFDGKYKDRIRLQDTVNCILSQNYYLMDADRIWGHNKMKLSPETPSVFYMDRNTMSLTGIATWNSACFPWMRFVGFKFVGGQCRLLEVTWQWQNLLVTGNIIRQSIALRYGNLRMPSE